MAIGLHPDCKTKLKEKLKEQLGSIKVTNKSFLDRDSLSALFLVEEPLPKHGSLVEKLKSFISEWPFYDFLCGYLPKELEEKQEFDSEVPVCKLIDLKQYSNVPETADRLVELFDTLPW